MEGRRAYDARGCTTIIGEGLAPTNVIDIMFCRWIKSLPNAFLVFEREEFCAYNNFLVRLHSTSGKVNKPLTKDPNGAGLLEFNSAPGEGAIVCTCLLEDRLFPSTTSRYLAHKGVDRSAARLESIRSRLVNKIEMIC